MCNGDLVVPEGFLPNKFIGLEMFCDGKSLVFESKHLNLDRFTCNGNVNNIVFPKSFTCQDLNLSSCNDLQDVQNIQKVKSLNLPMSTVANMAKKLLKFNGPVRMNGWGPY
jgi:hypothetical protein